MASKLSKLFRPCAEKLNGDRRNKLLVLNLGGLLYQNTRSRKDIPALLPHDFSYGKRIVFKRPFYEEFLEFCFERFDVGIWSSLQSQNFEVVLENIMGESKSQLKFAWHQGHCTMPGFKWKNSERKPLFLKDLEKLGAEPKLSSHFSLSNTLLIDNEPYKALLNPHNTAIFPYPYKVSNVKDTFLGPEGELQVFLDGLANAEDVPSYVKENRIGQPALTSSHPDWGYYSDMLKVFTRFPHDRDQARSAKELVRRAHLDLSGCGIDWERVELMDENEMIEPPDASIAPLALV